MGIIIDKDANEIEKRVATVLKYGLQWFNKISIVIVSEQTPGAELLIYLGKTAKLHKDET